MCVKGRRRRGRGGWLGRLLENRYPWGEDGAEVGGGIGVGFNNY